MSFACIVRNRTQCKDALSAIRAISLISASGAFRTINAMARSVPFNALSANHRNHQRN